MLVSSSFENYFGLITPRVLFPYQSNVTDDVNHLLVSLAVTIYRLVIAKALARPVGKLNWTRRRTGRGQLMTNCGYEPCLALCYHNYDLGNYFNFS